MRSTFALLALVLFCTPTLAQIAAQSGPKGPSPYAGMERREIKSLSSEEMTTYWGRNENFAASGQ